MNPPVDDVSPDRTRVVAESRPLNEAAPSILLVDDHPARLLTYEAVLAGMPVQFVRANSGDEALQLLLKQTFALILLDVNMPGIDGFEVGRHVRSHPRLEKTPIIFVSGERLTDVDRLKGYEVGAVDYISLPIVPEILRSKVALLVEMFNRRAELDRLSLAAAEAKRALGDAAPAASATHLRALFETTTDAEFILRGERDADGVLSIWRFVDVNPSALSLYGLGRDAVVGKTVHEVFPERVERTAMLCQNALLGGQRLQHEAEFGGRQLLVRMFAVDAECVAVSCTDISDRKRIEHALANSERRLQIAHDSADLGSFDWNIPSDTATWDARAREMWGLEPDAPLSFALAREAVHPEDRPAVIAAVERSLRGEDQGRYRATYRVKNVRDGRIRWVESHGQVLFENGAPVRMVGTKQDVTERMQAIQALCEGEERFRELANNIDQIVWTCDSLGRPNWYNDRWYEFSGATIQQMADEGWAALIHPDHRDRVVENYRRCIAAGENWEETFPVRGRGGEFHWFLSRGIPIRAGDGTVLRWFGTNTDITSLRELQDALTDADRRKDEFLAMLAHELRNPVAPILNVAEILGRTASADPEVAGHAAVIRRQAAHLSRMLDDLLDVARITRGRIELRRDVFDVDDCVALALETVAPSVQAGGHPLEVLRPGAPLFVDGDRDRLGQCITNLLKNAVKFSEPGAPISIRVTSVEGRAVIEVRDGGRGIPAAMLPRIFELFVQADRSLDRRSGGLGIGLSVCKRLVDMHGGTLEAFSEGEGRGSTFTMSLPLVAGPAVPAPTSAPVVEGFPSALRILVVDDNRDAADSIALLLGLGGHDCRVAYDGHEALAAWQDYRPDVVLLDIGLPGLDGYEVMKRVRAGGFTGHAIAISGYGQPEDRLRTAAVGFDAHLVKPVDPHLLERTLAGVKTITDRGRAPP
jgi:PAS domain S-box-containing protein